MSVRILRLGGTILLTPFMVKMYWAIVIPLVFITPLMYGRISYLLSECLNIWLWIVC